MRSLPPLWMQTKPSLAHIRRISRRTSMRFPLCSNSVGVISRGEIKNCRNFLTLSRSNQLKRSSRLPLSVLWPKKSELLVIQALISSESHKRRVLNASSTTLTSKSFPLSNNSLSKSWPSEEQLVGSVLAAWKTVM